MSSQLTKLNAFKQNLISFVLRLKQRESSWLSSFAALRIPKSKADKVFGLNRCRAGHIVRIAALIGLPGLSLSQQSSPLPQIPKGKQMAEESSLQSVLQNADQLFDENHFLEVIDVLDKYQDQDLPDIKWRKARAQYSVAKATKDKKEKEKLINNSFELIKTAVQSDPNNFAAHKWMAIIMDSAAELQGIKARILQLDNIKFHMQEALRLNPNDPTSWHLFGAYEFGLAELSWIQRKLVSTIFASPPTGSYEKALECFEKAETLKEGFYSTNWLMIGKCYMALQDVGKAKEFFEKAANCAVLNEDDKTCKEEAVALLRKL